MARRVSQPVLSGAQEVRITPLRPIRVAAGLSLALLGLQAAGALVALPAPLRFFAAVVTLVAVPGAVLAAWLVPLSAGLLRAPLAAVFGLSLCSLLLIGMDFLGAGLGAMSAVLQGVAAVIAVVGLGRSNDADWRQAGLWLAVLGGLALLVLAIPARIGIEQDAFDHIGYLRRVVATHRSAGGGVLAWPVDATALPGADPRKGALHVLLALIALITRTDPMELWRLLPAALYPLSCSAYVAFSAYFVARRWQLVLVAVAFVLLYAGSGARFVDGVAYGQSLSVLWYWITAAALLDTRARACARSPLWMALVGAAGVSIHVAVAWHLGLLCATLLLFPSVAAMTRREAVRQGAAVMAGVTVMVLLRWTTFDGVANEIHTHPQGLLYLTDRWFVMSPAEILRQHGLVFLGGLVLLPFLIRCRDAAVGRGLRISALAVAVSAIPFIAVPLYDRVSYLVFRSLLNAPVFAIVVSALSAALLAARRARPVPRVVFAAAIALWSLWFVAPSVRSVVFGNPLATRGPDYATDLREAARYLNTLPEGTVVLSDPRTSYALSAMTSHPVVAMYGQHGHPMDPVAMDRLRVARDVLSPYGRVADAIRGCERYAVDVVVVNGRSRADASDFLGFWDSGEAEATLQKLNSLPGRFRRIFERDSVIVFLHDPAGVASGNYGPASPFDSGTATGENCSAPLPGDFGRIVSAAVVPDRATPGETVMFSTGFSLERPGKFGFPLEVHVRFDRDADARAYPGDKHLRRWRERMGGELRRFRADRAPYGGRVQTDLWPVGIVVYDSFPVKVPSWAATGEWRVEVSARERSLLPNFTLSDFVFNRDSYAGYPCARLTVSGQVTQ